MELMTLMIENHYGGTLILVQICISLLKLLTIAENKLNIINRLKLSNSN